MATIPRRKPVRRWFQWRKPLSLDSLKMMVMSGVVRRADWAPPLLPTRTVYWYDGVVPKAAAQDPEPEQGWLFRILGRTAPALSSHEMSERRAG